MYEFLLIAYLVVSVALIGFILVQQGKGASMGASFGSGVSGRLFGSRGAGNFLSHTTAVLATVFFLISIVLGNLNSHHSEKQESSFENLSKVATQLEQSLPAKKANTDIPQ